jgi:hypothetical protein
MTSGGMVASIPKWKFRVIFPDSKSSECLTQRIENFTVDYIKGDCSFEIKDDALGESSIVLHEMSKIFNIILETLDNDNNVIYGISMMLQMTGFSNHFCYKSLDNSAAFGIIVNDDSMHVIKCKLLNKPTIIKPK